MSKKERNKDRGPGQTTMTFSLPEELKEKIEAAAAEEQRSRSNWLVVHLQEIVEEHLRQESLKK